MIRVLTGDNSFEIDRALAQLKAEFSGTITTRDGEELTLKQLPDLLMGMTLFSEARLVIIKRLSLNKDIWQRLPDWLPRLSDDVDLVLVEEKLDKRTATYKLLKENAVITEYTAWTERDTAKAESWLLAEAEQAGVKLDKKLARHVVARVGADQWQLAAALETLRFADTLDQKTIDDLVEANPAENVFNLFEAALKSDAPAVHRMVATLELTQDPYQLFGLLSAQVFQLAVLHSAQAGDNPAKEFGMHPFVVSKMSSYAKKLSTKQLRTIVKAFASADADMKRSRGEPWLLIERALTTVATL